MKKEAYFLETREDAVRLLLNIIRPLKQFYSEGKAFLEINPSGVHYGRRIAGMEGFARILWGLGPLWATANEDIEQSLQAEAAEWQKLYITGIKNGTDPDHPEYWGEIDDFDQRMVEMAALAVSIALSPQAMYYDLPEKNQKNLYHWLNRINQKQVHANNWRYFRILVNMLFQLLDLPYSKNCLEDDFGLIQSCYTSGGWYFDGVPTQVDYYVSFAIHFYGLIYAKLMEKRDSDFYKQMLEKSNAFAKDFVYWFANDGRELPFGRSLTYRFAHNSFFGALAFAGGDGLDLAVMKNLVLRNLEAWMALPIFDHAGVLSIGYHYPNLVMSEYYNGGGSPYWALKSFIMLALPGDHPFWQEEKKEVAYLPKKRLAQARMLITHDEKSHLQAFVAGQHCRNDHGACTEKYEKLVYSNQFGFSVSRGRTLEMGAFDSCLALSMDGTKDYQLPRGEKAFEITEDYVKSSYQWRQRIDITTIAVPLDSWHVRIHRICTNQTIAVADGGYAIEAENEIGRKYERHCQRQQENACAVLIENGSSGAVSFSGGKAQIIRAFPNTNLFYPLTVIPTICYQVEAGEHILVDAFYGERGGQAGDNWQIPPTVIRQEQNILIRHGEREIPIPIQEVGKNKVLS